MKKGIIVLSLMFLVVVQISCSRNGSSKIEDSSQFNFYLNGGVSPGRFNPFRLTDDPLVGIMLFEIRKSPKDALAVSTITGLDEELVKRKLEECRELEIVKEKEGKYVANFNFLDKEEKHEVRRLADKLAAKELEIIRKELDNIRDVFDKCSFERQGFNWTSMSHLILGSWGTDMAVMERGSRRYGLPTGKTAPLRPGGGRYWIHCIEGGKEEFVFANSRGIYENDGFGVWYCNRADLRPKLTWLKKEQWTLVRHLMSKGSDNIDGLCDASEEPCRNVKKMIKTLTAAKWISKEGANYTVAFPVFYQDDIDKLLEKFDVIGSEIMEEVYVNSEPEVKRLFKKMRPDLDEKEYGCFIGIVKHWVEQICLKALMDDGIMERITSGSVQLNWAWIGSFDNK
jgi:hypothetical protein